MKHVDLNDIIKKYPADTILKGYANAYKIRMKARRQLREVDSWLKFLKKNTQKDNPHFPKELFFTLSPIYLASVVRYTGWFKSVNRKQILKRDEVFQGKKKLSNVHDCLMKTRDKVFAHPEFELAGGDDFQAIFNSDGKVSKISSTFFVRLADNVETFHECVIHAHNKLDDLFIPKAEKTLLKRINRNELRSSRRK